MKQVKRVFALMLAMLLLFTGVDWLSCMGIQAYAESTPTLGTSSVGEQPEELLSMGEWLFWIEDEQATVAGYEDADVQELTIPAHLGGYPVTGIGRQAFRRNTALSAIQIPTNVTRIADDAFMGLERVTVRAYHGAYALLYAASHSFRTINLSTECVFAKGVIDLSGLPSGSYSGLSEEGVSFKAGEVSFLAAGQIINFPKNPGYPTGLIRRVESITASGDQIRVVFSQPEWGECFELVSGEDQLIFDWDNLIIRDSNFVIDEFDAAGWVSKGRFLHIKTDNGTEIDLNLSLSFGEPVVKYEIGTKLWHGLLLPEIKTAAVDFPINSDVSFNVTNNVKKVDPHSNKHAQLIKRNLFDLPVFSVMGIINGYVSVGVVVELEGEFKISAKLNCVYHFEKNNGKGKSSIEKHWSNLNVEVKAELKAGPEVSIELVLGWKTFNISFFSASLGAYLKLAGSVRTQTIRTGTLPYLTDVDAGLSFEVGYSVKIGLIKYEYWDPIKRENKEHMFTWYLELKDTFGPWYIFHGHWDNGKKVSSCTLEDRKYVYRVDGKDDQEGKANVNSLLTQPTNMVEYKERHIFRGWYVDTQSSGLPGEDYAFDFARDTMPYCGELGTLVIYARFDPIPVMSVTLDKSSATIYTEDRGGVQLSATVLPKNAKDTSVIWSSSNERVAKVNSNGKVVPVAAGTATITCKSSSNSDKKATFTITVKQYAEGVNLSSAANEIFEGETLQISAAFAPADTSDKRLRWSSSDPSIATVDQNGKVTGVKTGAVDITALALDRSRVSGSYRVNILLPVTGIELDRHAAVIYTNNTTGLQLHPTLTPREAILASVKWQSSNPAVATVDQNGLVRPVAPGTATITCISKSDGSVTDTCTVTVKQYVESILVSSGFASVAVGDPVRLSAQVGPSNATDKRLVWSSSDPAVATVDQSGAVTGQSAGFAVLTATAADGSGVSHSVKLRVIALPSEQPAVPVTGISLGGPNMTVYTVHKTAQLNPTITPAGASCTMTWASSDESVATVDDSGRITMLRGGTTLLTGRSATNPRQYVNCNLRVVQSVETINIEGERQAEVGQSVQLTAIVGPANAENKAVTWRVESISGQATVNQSGLVTGVSNGVVRIFATAQDGSEVSASTTVKIGHDPIPVESVTLDITAMSKYTNEKSGTVLTPTVLPEYADDLSVYWTSSDQNVAVVDRDGKVSFVAPGHATITCHSMLTPSVFATCEVTVKQYVEQLVLDIDSSALLPGETAQLTATAYPTNASDKSVIWSSSDAAIASVDQTGKVTAVGYGTASIKATAADGSGAEAEQSVIVEKELQLEVSALNDTVYTQGSERCDLAYVTLSPASVRRMAESGYPLEWTMNRKSGSGDTDMTVLETSYGSYSTSVALLNGAVFPAAGTEVYTVTCKAGPYEDSVDVTITVDGTAYAEQVKLTDASVSSNTLSVTAGDVFALPSGPIPADGKPVPQNMRMSVSGDSYYTRFAEESQADGGTAVQIDESGVYTAEIRYSRGNLSYQLPATIYVADESGVVHLRVENIELDRSFLDMVEGESVQLSAVVTPEDAYESTVSWESSDSDVVRVTPNGLVTAVAPGTAAITCRSTDGTNQAAICTVTVESYLQLDDNALSYTVYTGGNHHAELGIVNVTIDSQRRLTEDAMNVTWRLERISGESAELGLSEFSSVRENGLSVSGNQLKLLRIYGTGTDTYRLSCTAGAYTDSCLITLTVKDAALPSAITLRKTTYSAQVDDWMVVDTRYTTTPLLPEDVSVRIEGGRAFQNALSGLYSLSEPEQLIFETAGSYSAWVCFSGDNYSYRCPITLNIADEEGVVPVPITNVEIDDSDEPLMLTTGDTRTLAISVEPTNASYSKITWSSSNTAVATISSTGRITAIGPGYATILATVPESDYQGSCLVYVEEGINFRENEIERTVFVDGETRMTLDTLMLTDNTSSRLSDAPEWTLRRVSGVSLTLRAEPVEALGAHGGTLYGCALTLYSVSKEGDTIYELTCSDGEDSKTATIVVHAVNRDRMLPASIALDRTSFTADIGELIVYRPLVSTFPQDTHLPNGLRLSCEGDRQFQEALNAEDTGVSQNLCTFSFHTAGTYEVKLVFSYANVRYLLPVTFYIRDENGNVPVQSSRMTLNQQNLYLVAGEEADLEAVFTPANATNQAVSWVSSNSSVVRVDQNGHVTALANGTATITCTADDNSLQPVTCAVTVEDYLTVETGATSKTLYLQGRQDASLGFARLSEGTSRRLKADGLTPVWMLDSAGVNHAVIVESLDEAKRVLSLATSRLLSGGTDTCTVSCQAGDYSWSKTFTLKVVDLGATAPQSVTLRDTNISAAVNEAVAIDFSPILSPTGARLPAGMIGSGIVGVGDFYEALDENVFSVEGNICTVAFTRPGKYLMLRRYLLGNLQYVTWCTVTVGEAENCGLLRATEQSYTVYSGGRSGSVSHISLTDAMVTQFWGDTLTWKAERLSGNSLTVALKETDGGVDVFVANVLRNGMDVWRVSCSFGDVTEYVDLTLTADTPRAPLPSTVTLGFDSFSGMIGDWISVPLGVVCEPAGSMLPDQGDDFWSFHFDQAGDERSSHRIENGLLRVCFTMSGYYTGTLRYQSGNVSYEIPVYFVIQDEEQEVQKPDLSLYAVQSFSHVYPEGETGLPIARIAMSEGPSTYSLGAVEAYMRDKHAQWTLDRNGDAAKLSLRNTGTTCEIVVDQIYKPGMVTYTVKCSVDGETYSYSGSVTVAAPGDPRPDVTLIQTRYDVRQGDSLVIDRHLYSRENGSVLQSDTGLNSADALLAAAGYELNEKDGSWTMTFYETGTFQAVVSAQVSNLTLDIPLTITVYEDGNEPAQTVLRLPAALTTIEDEAFEETGVSVVDLRDTDIQRIGAGAFKNSPDLKKVYLPASVTSIAADAFYGCLNVAFCCEPNSYAASWATQHNIPLVED